MTTTYAGRTLFLLLDTLAASVFCLVEEGWTPSPPEIWPVLGKDGQVAEWQGRVVWRRT